MLLLLSQWAGASSILADQQQRSDVVSDLGQDQQALHPCALSPFCRVPWTALLSFIFLGSLA